jgi:hypothetical protein
VAAVLARARIETRILCPTCGGIRDVTPRQARRIASPKDPAGRQCRECLIGRLSPRQKPDEEDHRFWLERFNDREIVDLCIAFYGQGSPAAVATWRERLGIPASGN